MPGKVSKMLSLTIVLKIGAVVVHNEETRRLCHSGR